MIKHQKKLGIVGALLLIFVWLGVGIVGAIVGKLLFGPSGEELSSVSTALAAVVVPHAFGLVFVLSVVFRLGWRDSVFIEPTKVQRWVWIAPLALVIASSIVVDYSRLISAPLMLTLVTVCGVLLIASSEEVMFRGIQLQVYRSKFPEFVAMMISTLLFASSHMINSLSLNPLQVIITFLGGYIFYLTRRVSGGLVVPILVHAYLDLSIFSITLGPGFTEDNRAPLIILVEAVVFMLFLALFPKLTKPSAVSLR